ncbi:MAG: AAA family ATPase [Planctomycetes bacterium]|nr:AAA family ATPase [Planctomycetota bacterium]
MRIVAIRGRNLASLAREFALELDRPPLRDVGLFAITGPVGAGKSTLLDAVCLALFDRTPRLSGRGGAEIGDDAGGDLVRVHDVRGVLRHDATDGFAEVEFVGTSGRRLRARWSLRRARQRLDGRLQAQEMALSDVATGAPLGGGRRTEVLALIERELGLSFAQFRRSVLLAQGDFAAFLQASAAERAQLLERLTDAEVYRRLSKAAFDRAKAERHKLDKLQVQFDEHRLLDEAARTELLAAVAAATRDRRVAEVGVQAALQHVAWHETAERNRESESQAMQHLQQALADHAAAAPRRERVRRLRAAQGFVVQRRVVVDAEEAAGVASVTHAAATELAAAARDRVAATERQLAAALALIGGDPTSVPPLVSDFDRWLPDLEATSAAWQEERRLIAATTTVERQLADAEQRVTKATESAATASRQLEAAVAEVAVAEHACAAAEFEELPARRQRQRTARRAFAVRDAAWRELVAAGAALDALRTQEQRAAAGLAEAQRQMPLLQQQVQQAATELQNSRAAARAERLRSDLGVHRHALQVGQPCPLCGAVEHPFATGAPADGSADSREAAAERTLQAVRAAEVAQQTTGEHLQRQLDGIASQLPGIAERWQVAHAAWQQLEEVPDATDPLAVTRWLAQQGTALEREDEAIQACEQRRLEIAKVAESARAAQRRLADQGAAATAALGTAKEQAQSLRSNGEQLAARLHAVRQEIRRWLERLRPAWATLPNAEGEFGRRGEAWSQAVQAAAKACRGHAEAIASLQEMAKAERDAAARSRAAQNEAATARSLFGQTIAEHGVDVADVDQAMAMKPRQLADEERALRELDEAVLQARAVVRERVAHRQRHESHARPEMDLAECRRALDDAKTAQNRESERLQELVTRQAVDDQARRHRAELAPHLQQQTQRVQVWAAVDELIGSASGDKFGVFAQGLTMDLLLDEANRRLAELAPRYRLQRLRQSDLDFAIVDRDLGNTLRSVRSLSGGETFLVSLALALALATLAAERTRIETLFLDEGFGTLDAQSLETALAALDALQATGCQVGVISHVEGFAERVGTVVEVRPDGSGQSRLFVRSGAG